MKLANFNPADGSFDYIANDDGSRAITFYQLGKSGTHFQFVTGADGSVNIDAKTPNGEADVDIGLWPQQQAGVYIQSEVRSNWLKLSPSDGPQPIHLQTGGAPYTHPVPVLLSAQGSDPFALGRSFVHAPPPPRPVQAPQVQPAPPLSAIAPPQRRGLRGFLIRLLSD